MIPLIFVWLLWRYIKSKKAEGKILTLKMAFFLLASSWTYSLSAQETVRNYTIYHNGSITGKLRLYENVQTNKVQIRIDSDVKLNVLIRINVQSLEEAIFENGILVSSTLRRIVNGHDKVNQQLLGKGHCYQLNDNSGAFMLPCYPIRASIVWLYHMEPVGLKEVFSDNFRKNVPVEKVDSCRYRVRFPNGHENFYTYQQGLCTKVEVHQALYNVEFVLTN
jgi:hypothetical protein